MTNATIISMLIGLGLPLLVALVTREVAPQWLKVGVLALLSAISGTLTALNGQDPTTLQGWEHVALNILMTFAMAIAADVGAWKKVGTTDAIAKGTARFGIGWRQREDLPQAA